MAHEKLVRVVGPLWATVYLVIFKGFNSLIFLSLLLYMGIWKASLVDFFLYLIWSTIFYVILLQTDSFENVRERVNLLLKKKNWKLFIWLRRKLRSRSIKISPWWIAVVFIVESPLTGVPMIRLMFPQKKWIAGMMWVIFGCALEVVSWYLPLYGGLFLLLKKFALTL